MVLWVLLQIMYMYLHIYCKVIFIVTNSFKFLSTACHLFLKDRVVDVLNACNSPYSKKSCSVRQPWTFRCSVRHRKQMFKLKARRIITYPAMPGRFVTDHTILTIDKKKPGRFTLWSKGATNHTGTWFDSSDLPNPNNNLRMDSTLTY